MSVSAIIINPDAYKRMLLKQATTLMSELQRVYQAPSFREAVARIENLEGPCDIIFMASDLDPVDSEDFIGKCLILEHSRDAAFIVVLDSKDRTVGNVAQHLLSGANGILMAPFSIEDLSNVIAISTLVKKQRALARQKQALRILIDEIINKLDAIWYNYCNAQPAGLAIRELRSAAAVLKGLSEDEVELYYEIAGKMFDEVPVPPVIPKKVEVYLGASSRVKKAVDNRKKSLSLSDEGSDS
jgi:AmiR/NasT family two-component response regulator